MNREKMFPLNNFPSDKKNAKEVGLRKENALKYIMELNQTSPVSNLKMAKKWLKSDKK
jgi:hypothetical protein